jgi:hypothetical protein
MGQDSQPVWGSSVTTRVVVRRKLRAARFTPFFRGSWVFPHRRLASLSFLRHPWITSCKIGTFYFSFNLFNRNSLSKWDIHVIVTEGRVCSPLLCRTSNFVVPVGNIRADPMPTRS